MEYLHTRRLCYGCRSEQVSRDYEKCPSCRLIDRRRIETDTPIYWWAALVLVAGIGTAWLASLMKRNLIQ